MPPTKNTKAERILRFIEAAGPAGLRLIDIQRFAFEMNHPDGDFRKRDKVPEWQAKHDRVFGVERKGRFTWRGYYIDGLIKIGHGGLLGVWCEKTPDGKRYRMKPNYRPIGPPFYWDPKRQAEERKQDEENRKRYLESCPRRPDLWDLIS